MSSLDQTTILMVVDIARLLRKRFEKALGQIDMGLTTAEARTLSYISRHPGLRQTVLAEGMNVEPMTMVGFLDSLEEAGLICRSVDPQDRRAKRVTLSKSADDTIGKIQTVIEAVNIEVIDCLTKEESDQLDALLQKVKGNLLNKQAESCGR